MIKNNLLIIIFLFIYINISAQVKETGIPFVKNYSHTEYNSNNQNLAIVQDNRGIMYFANQTVILEYDGITWRQIFLPNDPNIYSLAKDKNGRIYVGASKGELGYLHFDKRGLTKYISLKNKIPEEKKQFTRVRKIVIQDEQVLFITPMTIFVYENDSIKTFDINKESNRFVLPFQVNDKLYIQERGTGLLEYKDDKITILKETSESFAQNWITGMFPYKNNATAIVTWGGSVFSYKNKKITPISGDSLLYEFYSYSNYDKNHYACGTYSNGFILIDKNFRAVKHISTKNGLQNNQVWSTYTDKDKNIWLGLGNGISVIYANSPYSIYNENYGLSGTTYTSMLHNEKLYVGNSTGVFYKTWVHHKGLDIEEFKPVKNKKGAFQIWKIDTIFNQLLCSGASGFFYIKDGVAKYLKEDVSIKTFKQLKKHPKTIIAGGGNGLSIFEYKNKTWKFKNNIKNFKQDCLFLEEDNDGYFWVSDINRGIYRFKLNEEKDSLLDLTLYNHKNGLPSETGNYVFKLSNRIVFTTEKGIYRFNKSKNEFVKDEKFDKIFDYDIKITLLLRSKNGNIWFKEEVDDPKIKNKKHWILGQIIETKDSIRIVKTPFLRVKDNIFSLNFLSEKNIIIGTEKGFVYYDLKYNKNFNTNFATTIRKIEFIKNDSLIFGGALSDSLGIAIIKQETDQIPQIEFEYNALRFNFAAIFFEEPEQTQYKFMLEGDDNNWSDWKDETSKEYSNLQPGTYTFKVKAKNLYDIESTIAEYKFEILPPWYRTLGAYIFYLLLFLFFIWSIVQLSIRRVKLQKENLERIVKERTAEIEKNKEEIETQRDSLATKNEEINRKNKDITASITYAKRIQEAMLPLQKTISNAFDDVFILFKPRDIVSGDFYWFAERNNKIIITAVDCTGHGVPGAFMSMIGSEILTTIVNSNVTSADLILEKMNKYVVTALKQTSTSNQDGMDMALCVIDKEAKTVEFAGAKNPLIYFENGEMHNIKGDRQAIGGSQKFDGKYTKHIIKYESPTWFYIFSDGYQDQFGGEKNRKFMVKKLKNLLTEIHNKPAKEQHKILDLTIETWMKDTIQTDDILHIGFKL